MWHTKFVSWMWAVAFVASAQWGFGQINEEVNTGADPYSMTESFFKLPEGRTIRSAVGMALDRDGSSVWVFDRCGQTDCVGSNLDPILKFDASGTLVESFGAGMIVSPHGINTDVDGNVWVTDYQGPDGIDPRRDGKGHQVFKFSPNGELLMTLGKAGVAGNGPDEFNQPSDVFVAPNGNIFVADGHGGESARIVKFSESGEFIKTWGTKGTAPGEFETPHALAMDSRGRLFVGDRRNDRVQIFDQDGTFLEEWTGFGRPSGMYIDRNDILYVGDSVSDNPAEDSPWKEGIRIGSVADGEVTRFIVEPEPDGSQEGIVVDHDGNIYTSLGGGMVLRKYVKK